MDEAIELLQQALILFDGDNELCDEVESPEWIWKFRARYLIYDYEQKQPEESANKSPHN